MHIPRVQSAIAKYNSEVDVGPGSELKKLIPKLFGGGGCGCNDYAKKMDRWGVAGCESRFDEIVAHLMHQAKKDRVARYFPGGLVRNTAERWVRLAIERAKK